MFNVRNILKNSSCRECFKRLIVLRNTCKPFIARLYGDSQPNILLDFEQNENEFFHQYMISKKQYRNCLAFLDYVHLTELPEYENSILNFNVSDKSIHFLLEYFKILLRSVEKEPKNIETPQFLNLCELLLKRIPDFSDDQLLNILKILTLWPKNNRTIDSKFFIMCKEIDDELVKRMRLWGRERLLLTMDHFYRLRIVRYSNFFWDSLKRVCRNPYNSPTHQVVHSVFLLNVAKWSHPVGSKMLDMEYALEQKLYELSVEELAIVALGFFKCGAKLTNFNLIDTIYTKLEARIDSLDSYVLAACLKILRTSTPFFLRHRVTALYDKLIDHIDQFTLAACIHIALLGTQHVLVFHPAILQKITERLLKEISSARLKDMERIIFALSLFNFTPDTKPNIFIKVIEELRTRDAEIYEYRRPFLYLNSYLIIMGIYDYEFINGILSPEFLTSAFKDISMYVIPPSVLQIACGVKIDCPNYDGNNLDSGLIQEIGQYLCHRNIKMVNKGRTKSDKFLLQLWINLKEQLGGEDFVHLVHSLPYSQRLDLIFCMKDGKPVKIPEDIKAKEKCLEVVPPPNIGKWYAVVTLCAGNMIADTDEPVGSVRMKIRHLNKLGYKTSLVKETEWENLDVNKAEYLKKIIENC